jgi:hypothetical protein
VLRYNKILSLANFDINHSKLKIRLPYAMYLLTVWPVFYGLTSLSSECHFSPHVIENLKCVHNFFEERSSFTNRIHRTIQLFKRKILNPEIKYTFWVFKQTKDRRRSTSKPQILTNSRINSFVKLCNFFIFYKFNNNMSWILFIKFIFGSD